MRRKISIKAGKEIVIDGDNTDKLLRAPNFQGWLSVLAEGTINIQEIAEAFSFWIGDRLLFALFFLNYLNEVGRSQTSTVFFRSNSVGIFLTVKNADTKQRHVVLVEQLRVPCGRKLLEIPAGRIEDGDDSLSTAIREINEEVGLKAIAVDLVSLGEYFLSPGACDEKMYFYSCELTLSDQEVKTLKNRLTGLKEEGESIKVKLFLMEEFKKLPIVDAKTKLAYDEFCLRKGMI